MRCRRPCGQGCASRRPRWAERAWRSGSGSSGSGSGSGSGSSSGSSSSSSSSSWLLLVLLQRSPRGLAPVRRLAHVKDQGESICVQTPSSGKNRHGAWSINNDNGNAIHTDGPGTRWRSFARSPTKPLPERGPHLCAPRPSSHNATTDGDAHQFMHKSPQACDIGIFLIRASINPKARTAQLASQPLGWTASVAPLCWTAWAPHEGTLTCSTR